MTDVAGNLQELVHQRTRLAILTIASEVSSVQFGYLQSVLELSPGNLGGHLHVLEEAKLVKVTKGFQGRRPSTAISITAAGRKALRAEITALKAIVERVERAESHRTPRTAKVAPVMPRGLRPA